MFKSGDRSLEKNRDVMYFLEMVLNICDELARYQTNTGKIFFRLEGETDSVEVKGHFAASLFACIFRAHQNETSELHFEISDVVFESGQYEHTVSTPFTQGVSYSSVCLGDDDKDGRYIQKLCDALQQGFLPQEDKEKITSEVSEVLKKREEIVKLGQPFPPCELLEPYLEQYYKTLLYFVNNEELLRTSEELKQLLKALLWLDCGIIGREKHEIQGSLLSPMALNAMRRMYLGVEEYYSQITRSRKRSKEQDVLNKMYRNTIIKKVQHLYRWYMNAGETMPVHVSVAPYIEAEEMWENGVRQEGNLCVQLRDIEQYNSYEGISELRIAEKILYELQRCQKELKENTRKEFRVAVLGDIHRKAMGLLAQYLNGILEYRRNTQEIVIDVYTKNTINTVEEKDRNITVKYHSGLDEQFAGPEKLGGLLEENHLTLMLDCIKLYTPMKAVASSDENFARKRFYLNRPLAVTTIEYSDFAQPNYLDELYEALNVFCSIGSLGSFRKEANPSVLQFCEEKIKNLRNRTLYVYVSDLRAFENTVYNTKYYVRTERYNQKEIGIIRFSYKVEPIKNGEEKMLRFNAWQIIKHIDLEDCDDIIKKVKEITGDNEIELHNFDMSRIYMGIDYKNWPNKLVLHYGINEEGERAKALERFARCFIENVILPVFNNEGDDLFQQYFWRAIYSLLYGDAQNVEDMLLIHLMCEEKKVGITELAKENDAPKVLGNIDEKYKYSIKRFYAMIIKGYDISAENSFNQIHTAYSIKMQENESKSNVEEIFQNVVTACKNIGYTESYLYQNCKNKFT